MIIREALEIKAEYMLRKGLKEWRERVIDMKIKRFEEKRILIGIIVKRKIESAKNRAFLKWKIQQKEDRMGKVKRIVQIYKNIS